MKAEAYQENGRISPKGIFQIVMIAISLLAGFYLSGVLFLCLAHFAFYGLTDASIGQIENFLLQLRENPLFLGTAYQVWFGRFVSSLRGGAFSTAGLLPLLPLVLFVAATVFALFKSPYSCNLWRRLKKRYAEVEDIKQMGLLEGEGLVLGKFQNQVLRLGKPLPVFVWGGIGCGKTMGVAIPSILGMDNSCLAAVDSSGLLAKYTSGYRAGLGPVFYFNWALQDMPEKGEFWPRWNPVSPRDLPENPAERDAYVRLLAECLLPRDKDNYWEDLTRTALEGFLLFFIAKIEKACANDYFLSNLLEKGRVPKDDKDLLLSYYVGMPNEISAPAIKALRNGNLDLEGYLPVGSWDNIPDVWKGKELCLGMLADCLIQRYFMITGEEDKQARDGWKIMLGQFLKEASIFNYHPRAVHIMQQLYYLTRNQRKIVFTMLMAPLTVFRKSNIRERTSLSDFSLRELRAYEENGERRVTTLYLTADAVKSSGFMSRLMIDMLIGINTALPQKNPVYPLAIVCDDFEQLPKFSRLSDALMKGEEADMPLLLLTDGLQSLQRKYGVAELEEIIAGTSYKLMMADTPEHLSGHFGKLAVYGTKSVQIPAGSAGVFSQLKKGVADANYYYRIARDLKLKHNMLKIDGEHYLLLAAGYYHLPANVSLAAFVTDDAMRRRAAAESSYLLEDKFVRQRNMQDIEAPKVTDVLQKAGVSIEREEDIDLYLEDRYDEVLDALDEDHSDIQTVWAEEISTRWKSSGDHVSGSEIHRIKSDDWWLDEEAFAAAAASEVNPFEKPIK